MIGHEIRFVVLLIILLPNVGIMFLLGLQMMRGYIEPNDLIGVRTKLTKSDPEIWYKTNAYAGRYMVWSAIVMLFLGGGLFFIRSIGDAAYLYIVCGGWIAFCIVLGIIAYVYPRSITRGKGMEK